MADKEPRQPTHRAYSVIKREGDRWRDLGREGQLDGIRAWSRNADIDLIGEESQALPRDIDCDDRRDGGRLLF